MQQNELHKLGKTDLLTLIYKQEKQIKSLTKEVNDLKKQLNDRTIQMKEAGSIAEASLKINKIFETAQQAADEYLESIKKINSPSQGYMQTDNDITKDELSNNDENNILSKNTYEKEIKHVKNAKKIENKQTKEKTCKELVLVDNKIMEVKPKLLKRVVILLVFLLKKLEKSFKKMCSLLKELNVKGAKKVLTIAKKISLIIKKTWKIMIKKTNDFYKKIIIFVKKILSYIKKIVKNGKDGVKICSKNVKTKFSNIKIENIKKTFLKFISNFGKKVKVLKLKFLNKIHNVKLLESGNGDDYKNIKIKIPLSYKLKNFVKSRKEKILEINSKVFHKLKDANNKFLTNLSEISSKLIEQKNQINKNIKNYLKNTKLYFQNVKNKRKKTNAEKDANAGKIANIKKKANADKNNEDVTVVKNIKISIKDIENEIKKRKDRKLKINFIRTLASSALVVIAFAIITSTSFFKILQVSGSSMEPNLHEGELLITSNFFKYKKGDMIAFYYNDSVLIKRIIATEGDIVNIEDDGTVFVNSVKLEENYVKELSYNNCDITFPYQVPKNTVFLLGDNRSVSVDSRSKTIGCVSKDKIIGKIKFKLNPFVIY